MIENKLKFRLEYLLKNYIKQRGHYETGRLSNSVSFYVKPGGVITLSALEYINYLERGNFILNFWTLSSVKEAIADYTAEYILQGFN